MKIKLLSEGAQLPKRATNCAAGYDLFVPADTVIKPGRNIVPLAISIAIPTGMEGQIRPRSGFSVKGMEGNPITAEGNIVEGSQAQRYDADVLLGTIDSDYRGTIGVLVKSYESMSFAVSKGTRIAQLVIAPYHTEDMVICDELDNTERADGGFGHTGTK